MKSSTTGRVAGFIYVSTLVAFGTVVLAYYFYFWVHLKMGPKEMLDFGQAQQTLQKFSNLNVRLESARNAAENDQPNEAANHIQLVDSVFQEYKNNYPSSSQEYVNFQNSMVEIKQLINQIISLPEGGELFPILEKKFKSFNEFARDNKWRILTQTSQRGMDRLKNINAKKGGALRAVPMNRITSDLSRDVDFMLQIATKARLEENEKQQIVARLESIRPELKMLNELAARMTDFGGKIQDAILNHSNMSQTMKEIVASREVLLSERARWATIGFIMLAGIPILMLFATPIVMRVLNRFARKEIESHVIEIFKRDVLANSELDQTDSFHQELFKIRNYIQKRMSFGSIFQDSLPFPSLLLDSNLKMIWANDHFFECWDSLEVKQNDQTITWDYLQKFTNFDSSSPLLQAAQAGLAGVYQIQINQRNMMMPYEMYVSPVEYQGQTRVMVIFYPLSAMQDTIMEQGRSIIGPVNKMLDALALGKADEDFKNQVAGEFDQAGITEIFDKLSSQQNLHDREREALLVQIEENENRLVDLLRATNDALIKQKKQSQSGMEMSGAFNRLKDQIIEYVDLRSKAEKIFHEQTQKAREYSKVLNCLHERNQSREDVLNQLMSGLENLKVLKANIHQYRQILDQYRTKALQATEQLLVTAKQWGPQVQEVFAKLRNDIREVEKLSSDYHQIATAFDVQESKLSLLKSSAENVLKSAEIVVPNVDGIDSSAYQFGKIMGRFDEVDQMTVDELKSFYQAVAIVKKTSNDIGKTLSNELIENSIMLDHHLPESNA